MIKFISDKYFFTNVAKIIEEKCTIMVRQASNLFAY